MDSRKRSIISNDGDMPALYKEWDEASCPICMDHPHNAVLLICTSHDKGCRSYICDTSYRHSNCFDRFKKLKEENSDTSLTTGSPHVSINYPNGNSDLSGRLDFGEINIDDKSEEGSNLKCPLCRGAVLGCKVMEEARKYLNLKSRTCSRESCSFSGNYRELRRHARRVHPTVRPADIDQSRQRAWRHLEDQREYNDIVSAINSSVQGSVVVGDYMIESGDRVSGEQDLGGGEGGGARWLSTLVLFQMIGSLDGGGGGAGRGGRSRGLPRHRRGGGSSHRRRFLWGENLLGLQDDGEEEDGDDDDEVDLNVLSDIGPPRRRRRLMHTRSDDEDRQ